MPGTDIGIVIAGSGGAGSITAAFLLLRGAAGVGHYGLFSRLSGPQVRGGEAAGLLRIGPWAMEAQPDFYHLFCAIDWNSVDRFAGEIPLQPSSVILHDPKKGEIPAAIAASGARTVAVPLSEMAARVRGGRANMAVAGFIAGAIGIPLDAMQAALHKQLDEKGPAVLESSAAVLGIGHAQGAASDLGLALPPSGGKRARWLLSGNEALGMGSLRGGVRFVAGYPITPATEVVEWMSPALPRLGGQLVLGEDELAAINMALGAAFGGVPSMTVTSGPGLSLMIESLGLAIEAEVPLVIVDVMRAGPSTGIPTKSEQADLNLAVYGAHGDAPRIVLSATSIADNLATTQWAVELSLALQVPVLVLSDAALGQSYAVIDSPDVPVSGAMPQTLSAAPPGGYKRYAITPSGVSPLALPGVPGCQWVGDGLTHNERGVPVSAAKDHSAQIEKRNRKLTQHDFGIRWADLEGEGDLAVIAWGSSVGAAREAIGRLRDEGIGMRLIGLRVIAPFPAAALERALQGIRRAIVVEQNHSGQLYHYLRGHCEAALPLSSYSRPGPMPLRPHELAERLHTWSIS